ncbi:Uncharacterised protein [Mycobacteroides abscessus subsp. abscessus]|nr:Uncharacterised protein [Mycobacteroides abscessus subsp. abscessus]
MKKTGSNCRWIHFKIGQDPCHLDWMDDVWLPGFPILFTMGMFRKFIGLPYDSGMLLI